MESKKTIIGRFHTCHCCGHKLVDRGGLAQVVPAPAALGGSTISRAVCAVCAENPQGGAQTRTTACKSLPGFTVELGLTLRGFEQACSNYYGASFLDPYSRTAVFRAENGHGLKAAMRSLTMEELTVKVDAMGIDPAILSAACSMVSGRFGLPNVTADSGTVWYTVSGGNVNGLFHQIQLIRELVKRLSETWNGKPHLMRKGLEKMLVKYETGKAECQRARQNNR